MDNFYVNLVLVVMIYIFSFVACLFVLGSIAQHTNLGKKIGDRLANILIVGTSVVLYILFVFAALNDWAAEMLN